MADNKGEISLIQYSKEHGINEKDLVDAALQNDIGIYIKHEKTGAHIPLDPQAASDIQKHGSITVDDIGDAERKWNRRYFRLSLLAERWKPLSIEEIQEILDKYDVPLHGISHSLLKIKNKETDVYAPIVFEEYITAIEKLEKIKPKNIKSKYLSKKAVIDAQH